jgi:hypothetical protein
MRLAASIERGSAYDRRRYQRTPVSIGAGLGSAQDRPSTDVTVVDLSEGGCGIESSAWLEAGARVWLKLPGLQSWPARVAWADGVRAGLEFDQPLHPAVVGRYRSA